MHTNTNEENLKSNFPLFADDAKLYHRIEPTDDKTVLQEDLKLLENWLREILLQFYEEKCVYLPTTSTKVLPTTEYSLNGVNLKGKFITEKDPVV